MRDLKYSRVARSSRYQSTLDSRARPNSHPIFLYFLFFHCLQYIPPCRPTHHSLLFFYDARTHALVPLANQTRRNQTIANLPPQDQNQRQRNWSGRPGGVGVYQIGPVAPGIPVHSLVRHQGLAVVGCFAGQDLEAGCVRDVDYWVI